MQATIEQIKRLMDFEEIPENYRDHLLANRYHPVPTQWIRLWEKIKKYLRDNGYTHLPNGDDL